MGIFLASISLAWRVRGGGAHSPATFHSARGLKKITKL